MPQYMFGTGQLFATPEGGGNPLRIGALQDVSFEFSGDNKALHGQYQFPLDVARGKSKVEGKIGTANIDVDSFNRLFFGGTVTADSEKKQAVNEAASIPANPGPYTVTVANAATYYLDLGVVAVATGLPMKQVSGAPATGEYSVDSETGIYTFAAADEGLAIIINYLYTATTANSGTLDINNLLMGDVPTFQLVASQIHKGKQFTICLYSCIADKLSLPLKQDDHTVSEISYMVQANAANQVGFLTSTSAVGGGA